MSLPRGIRKPCDRPKNGRDSGGPDSYRTRTPPGRGDGMTIMHGTSQDGAILSALLEALPEAVVLVDDDNRVAIANRASRLVLPALRVGEPLELALRTPDVLDAVRRVSASGKAATVSWRERVPVERLFDVHVAPLRIPGGGGDAVVITWRDLTEARSVERMRADFVANASHELRTRPGARRSAGARPVSCHHARAGAAHGTPAR